MKILIVADPVRYAQWLPDLPIVTQAELTYVPRSSGDDVLVAACPDAEVLFVDATHTVGRGLIARLPQLKMIHSEGVGFEHIDADAARELGVMVCNNAGCNGDAVAEQAVLLMLMLLRRALPNDRAIREGRQGTLQADYFMHPLTELADCTVGLIGFGDTARATARHLAPFGCPLFYTATHRHSGAEEAETGAQYLPQDQLLARCDIVSLHCPSNAGTRHLVDEAFLRQMKPTALLINTARGEVVDDLALRRALENGTIAGAGLDTLSPEPVPADHPLVAVPPALQDRMVLSPHVGGFTRTSFRRAHLHMWQDAAALLAGEHPARVVNGL
ncbi:MAG: NAD(P)-dependent oxidoreductase [Oscillospiraceae bacterium]